MLVVHTEHLAKTYAMGFFRKKIPAIRDINLQVKQGEIFGLLGPNGAGKTTTLKILMGLVRPSTGTAQLLGYPVGDLRAKRRIGYLPENPYFYDYLTGRELLVFMGKLFGLSRRQAFERAEKLLAMVDMTRGTNLALRRYSKGMLQRIGVAQALINDPELVVLDEPMSGLDPIGRKELRVLIAELKQQGKTVLLSSHILSDVELLADRVAIVVKGRTVNTGPLHELLDARIMSIEVVVPQPKPDLLEDLRQAGHSVALVGDAAQVTVDGALSIDPVIDQVRAHGCSVQMISPRKESLEDLVVKQVKAQEQ